MILVQNGDHFTTSKSATFLTDSGIHVFGSFDFDCGEYIALVDQYVFTPSPYADCEPDGAVNTGI